MTSALAGPVAVTGLGALTPLGPDVAALTEGLLTGRSGVRLLEGEQWDALPARLAATVDLEGRLERLEARHAIAAPMTFRGRSVGFLVVHDRMDGGGAFSTDDVRLVELFAWTAEEFEGP